MILNLILLNQFVINIFNTKIFQSIKLFFPETKQAMNVEFIGESIFTNLTNIILSFAALRNYFLFELLSLTFCLSHCLSFYSADINNRNFFLVSWFLNRASTCAPSYVRDLYLTVHPGSVVFVKNIKNIISPFLIFFLHKLSKYIYFVPSRNLTIGAIIIIFSLLYLSIRKMNNHVLRKYAYVSLRRNDPIDVRAALRCFYIIMMFSMIPVDNFLLHFLDRHDIVMYKTLGQLIAMLPLAKINDLKHRTLLYSFVYAVLLVSCKFYTHYNMSFLPFVIALLWGFLGSVRSVCCIQPISKGLGAYKMIVYYSSLTVVSAVAHLIFLCYESIYILGFTSFIMSFAFLLF